MMLLALGLLGIAVWNFVVGMWVVGIVSVALGVACIVEAIAAYNEDVFW